MVGRGRLPAPAVAVALSTGACAGTMQQQASALGTDQATVLVQNNNWFDMNIYAVRGGIRLRLGTVMSMTEARLKVPRDLLVAGADLRLVADPIGSNRGTATEPILVGPGQQVIWSLENHLALSSYRVR